MSRVGLSVVVAAVVGVSLTGCSSALSSNSSSEQLQALKFESDPPGADAKTSLGPSCRTPCMLPVPADREFTVNYSLNGYVPQVVPVRPRSVENFRSDGDVGGAPSAEVSPNPVYAQLEPAPPPAPAKKRGGRPKQPAKPPLR